MPLVVLFLFFFCFSRCYFLSRDFFLLPFMLGKKRMFPTVGSLHDDDAYKKNGNPGVRVLGNCFSPLRGRGWRNHGTYLISVVAMMMMMVVVGVWCVRRLWRWEF